MALNLLTVVPIPEIIPKGIPFIKATFDEKHYKPQFDAFWNYSFIKTWMADYPPELWNFTRNIPFVHTVKGESNRFVCLMRDIERGIARAPSHQPVTPFEIPRSYFMFMHLLYLLP